MPDNKDWTISEAWNIAMATPKQREESQRVHLWASELEKAPCDMWLRFKNTPVSNPPNERSQFKFKAGEWNEGYLKYILQHAGILQSAQDYTKFCIEPGLLEVSGKSDFIAGGIPSMTKALEFAEVADVPLLAKDIVTSLVKVLAEKYPEGLGIKPIEAKSCASFLANRFEDGAGPLKGHVLQLLHYIIGGNHPQGLLTYLCRDDLRMTEFHIYNNEENRKLYRDAVARMTMAVQAETMPAIEPLLNFEGKFSVNYNVAYSGYLTLLYKFESQREYEELYRPMASRFNRVVKRMKEGAKLTPKNMEIIAEAGRVGFNLSEYVADFVLAPEEEEVAE